MVVRNGMPVQVWRVTYTNKERFKYNLYIRGTETEMQEYMDSEMGYVGSYTAMTEAERDALKTLRVTIYDANKIYW